jgi:hypothetical protein
LFCRFQDKFILYTHKYKLRGYFDRPVIVDSAKTTFYSEKQQLELRLKFA